MFRSITLSSAALFLLSAASAGQNTAAAEQSMPQPIYRITIVSRTTKALNYGHLAAPTKIDFKGTPLLPAAHGDANVESRRGATLVHARFERVNAPTRFGPQYLTY